MCPPLRPSLLTVLVHHARATNSGDDPASLLRHAYLLRASVGAGRQAEYDAMVAGLEAKAKAEPAA
jgi:hypothetical protein